MTRFQGWRRLHTTRCRHAVWLALPLALLLSAPLPAQAPSGETLYNGIRLPAAWPPQPAAYPAYDPPPPYLTDPPSVIPIDIGRQLFVDDFLIESTTMSRTFHQPISHPSNPLVFPDRPWEGSYALAFSDGVFYDASDQLFKMWYLTGQLDQTALAVSTNGVTWDKPAFDVRPGTNIVRPDTGRDSGTVWLDHYETDPAKRFKTAWWYGGMQIASSADGIHWGPTEYSSGTTGDRSTFFYNPFRRKWIFSLRSADGTSPELIDTRRYGRVRRYAEGSTLIQAAQSWPSILGENTLIGLPKWLSADVNDLPTRHPHFNPQLYNVDAAAYESLIVGYFTILTADATPDRPKINEVSLGYSRDGFNFSRPDRRPFFQVSEDPSAWNYGNVQSTAGGGIVVGDDIYFYLTGRTNDRASTGLAVLRRDGFASMDAGASSSTLTTRPVSFAGRYLFVNADLAGGTLCAEVLDQSDQVIAPFTSANCVAVTTGGTSRQITWAGASDLSALRGRPVKFRFTMRSGQLYAFWVSPDLSGASYGYLTAGGPGIPGGIDTVGRNASPNNRVPTVSLTAPTSGTTLGAPVTVSLAADAADSDGSVTLVQFYANGALVGSDTTAPYTATWPNVATGTYTVTARAFDDAGGNGVSAPVTLTVGFPNNVAPVVSVSAPGSGAVFAPAEVVVLRAAASDADGTIARVDFFDGAQLIASDPSSPYEASWTAGALGAHTLTAVAVDNLNATASATVSVSVVAAGGPRLNVALATNGARATASSTYTTDYAPRAAIDGRRSGAIRGQVGTWEDSTDAGPDWLQIDFAAPYDIDQVGVISMQESWWAPIEPTPTLRSYLAAEDFHVQYWNGTDWVVVPGSQVVGNALVWKQVTFAPVTTAAIRIVVTKSAGGRTRLAEVEAYRRDAQNAAPSVAVLLPATGSAFTTPAAIQVRASAGDTDGSVSHVDFFAGAQPIGNDSTSPYEATWTGASPGTYSITAVATDDTGNSTTSSPVTVTVSSPPPNVPPTVSLTAPAAGSGFTVGDAVAVRATASDANGSVSRVDFYDGLQLIASDTTSPYEVTWTATPTGAHGLTAVAIDDLNAVTTSTAVAVTVAASGARINAAAAANGATATASSTYTADYAPRAAIDGRRAGAVRGQLGTWEDGGTLLPDWFQITFATPTTIGEVDVISMQERWWAPVEPTPTLTSYLAVEDFEIQSWTGDDWAAVSGGQVVGNQLVLRPVVFTPITTSAIRIVVTKVAGGIARLAEVEAWTAAAPARPTATLTATPTTITAGAASTLTWTTAGAVTVTLDQGIGAVAAAASRNVAPAVTTTYTLTATNAAGATTSTAVVTVQPSAPPNAPPTVSLTSPAGGAVVTLGEAVALQATASDPNGSVARVDFFVDSQLVAGDSTSPYEVTWTPTATGPHSLTAVAVDNLAAATTSTAVAVTVAAPGARINAAAAANGATATASSTYTADYAPRAAIDGRRAGAVRGRLGTWEDATSFASDWFQVTFAAPATIDQVNVFSIQERHTTPVEPTPTLTSYLAPENFEVQYWNGTSWVVVPGGQVVGNTLVWKQVNFAAVTTSAIRIAVTRVAGGYTRLAEVEAWTTPR